MKLLLLLLSLSAFAQTKVTPAQINFTGDPNSGSIKCVVGQTGFQTDATAGANKWSCTAANTWTIEAATPAIQNGSLLYCASAGGTDSYLCNFSPAFASYDADGTCLASEICTGTVVQFYADVQNTGTASFAPNGLAAKTIKKGGVTKNLANGDIEAGQVVTLAYNRVADVWQYQSQLSTIITYNSGLNGPLETHTASASASLDFTTCFTSAFDNYFITLQGFQSSTASVDMMLRFSTDGGATYISTGALYKWLLSYYNTGGPGTGSTAGANEILLGPMVSTGTGAFGMSGYLYAFNPLSTAKHNAWTWETASTHNIGFQRTNGAGGYMGTIAVNAFQILPVSGTLTVGTASCYGLAK